MRRFTLRFVLFAVAPAILIGCQMPNPDLTLSPSLTSIATEIDPQSLPSARVVALLADQHLVAYDAITGMLLRELDLSVSPRSEPIRSGHYLASSQDGETLFVLAIPDQGGARSVVVLDALDFEELGRITLSTDVDYSAITVGPRSGHVFAFGTDQGSAVATAIDTETGKLITTWRLRESGGYTWNIYQSRFDETEQHLYVSYLGRDTTGIDVFQILPEGPQRCVETGEPNWGCIGAHGGFRIVGSRLLVATGLPVVVETNLMGEPLGAYTTGLTDNLIVDFEVDPDQGRLIAVGACGYTGGMSSVDLDQPAGVFRDPSAPLVGEDPSSVWLTTPPPPTMLVGSTTNNERAVCGGRIALGQGGAWAALNKTTKTVPSPRVPGEILVLDTTTGQERLRIPTPAEAIDLVAIP